MFCFKMCLNGGIQKSTFATHRLCEPEIRFDPKYVGPEVILLSSYMRITGNGGALTTAPLVQSKSYFEIKIQQSGIWSVGLATRQADLSKKVGGTDKESWCLCSDNSTRHNDEEVHPVVTVIEPINDIRLNEAGSTVSPMGDAPANGIEPTVHIFPDEGDIVGVSFDHVELNFYYNGKNLDVPFRNVKGSVYPVVYVNGATIDIILDNFHYDVPPGFDRIMLEQSLL